MNNDNVKSITVPQFLPGDRVTWLVNSSKKVGTIVSLWTQNKMALVKTSSRSADWIPFEKLTKNK